MLRPLSMQTRQSSLVTRPIKMAYLLITLIVGVVPYNRLQAKSLDNAVVLSTDLHVKPMVTHPYSVIGYFSPSGLSIGGFDLLVIYERNYMSAARVLKGSLLEQCEWEYTTYRLSTMPNGNGLVRIVAIADQNNGSHHPICGTGFGVELCVIEFFTFFGSLIPPCAYTPIQFYWGDCEDNMIVSRTGDTAYYAQAVYPEIGKPSLPKPDTLPSLNGVPDSCLTNFKYTANLQEITFIGGGIYFACGCGDADSSGKINLNDAVYLIRYLFLAGDQPSNRRDGDNNCDGVVTISDALYLVDYLFHGGDSPCASCQF